MYVTRTSTLPDLLCRLTCAKERLNTFLSIIDIQRKLKNIHQFTKIKMIVNQ